MRIPQEQRYRIFATQFVQTGVARKAAEAAGYSPHTAQTQASRLLHHAKVQELIAEARAAVATATAWTAERWRQEVETVYRQALADGHYAAATKSLELIARHLGFLQDKLTVTITPAEREARAAALFDALQARVTAN